MQLCALLSFLTAGTNFVVTLGKGFPKTANEAICILTLPFLGGGGEILWMNVYCGCCLFFLSPRLSLCFSNLPCFKEARFYFYYRQNLESVFHWSFKLWFYTFGNNNYSCCYCFLTCTMTLQGTRWIYVMLSRIGINLSCYEVMGLLLLLSFSFNL